MSTESKPCTAIDKNLKSVTPAKHFQLHIPCAEPNQDIQIDFVRTIFDEKGNEIYLLSAINRLSKFPTTGIYE